MRFAIYRTGMIGGMVLLLAAALVSAATAADTSASAYAPVAGQWVGQIVEPSGETDTTAWTINPDGTFSIQTDRYTAVGSLASRGTEYVFTYERNGQAYTGTLGGQESNGRRQLIGRGESPNGPIDIMLTQAG
jgi:hypothetical protein